MSSRFQDLLGIARLWAERCAEGGWLSPLDLRVLMELDDQTPASLFDNGLDRPLVAAFFGGTGVGKSTLLNRLAGQPIARTGVERPTSREVSVYLHQAVQFRRLPQDFPLDQVRLASHRDDTLRAVLWIDMPDIDSIERHNRELVLNWLPHIDVLIYVVSPERYRDDKGWRLLQAHGGEHAWLFVINQWDRGHPAQYEDFIQLLRRGGFEEPVLLRTDSRDDPAVRKPDDFAQLQRFLKSMADRHVLRQLEIRAEALRLSGLRSALLDCLGKFGNDPGYLGLEGEWATLWGQTRDELLTGLEWAVKAIARDFVGHEANPLHRSLDLTREPPMAPPATATARRSPLWDDWAQDRLRDSLDLLVAEAGQRGLPARPLKSELAPLDPEAGRTVLGEGQRALRQALANPGNAFQRTALRISGALAVLLPLAAIGWVSYQVVNGYYQSGLGHLAYFGMDFAIHSGLLIVLSWLLPFFIYRNVRPSAERTAARGLRSGLGLALTRIGGRVRQILVGTEEKRQGVIEAGRRLEALAGIEEAQDDDPATAGLLGRVLPGPAPAQNQAIKSK